MTLAFASLQLYTKQEPQAVSRPHETKLGKRTAGTRALFLFCHFFFSPISGAKDQAQNLAVESWPLTLFPHQTRLSVKPDFPKDYYVCETTDPGSLDDHRDAYLVFLRQTTILHTPDPSSGPMRADGPVTICPIQYTDSDTAKSISES